MSRRIPHLALLLTAQTACVAVGLWIHHYYAKSSVRRGVEAGAWEWIEQAGDELASSLHHVPLAEMSGEMTAQAREIIQRKFVPKSARVFVTDGDWRVLLAGSELKPVKSSDASDVNWTLLPDPTSTSGIARQGRLETPEGSYLALAYPLQNGETYLLTGYPTDDIDAQVAALTQSFSVAAGVTLLWTCALLGITVYMIVSRTGERTQREGEQLRAESLRRMESMVRMRDAIVFGLAKLAESRDPDTGDHLERMSIYATTLSSALRHHPEYGDVVTPAFIRLIGISSALHDIGKVGIADAILLKPGPLDEEERARMQDHTAIGSECLLQIEQRLGSSNFLQMAREIAQAHHERWDGSGYPQGLSGTDIPLSARIVAIADVYDALSSRRVYKGPYAHEQCVGIIRNESGKAFDPQLVEVWLRIESRFRDIAQQYWSDRHEVAQDTSGTPGRGTDLEDIGPLLVGVGSEPQGDWS